MKLMDEEEFELQKKKNQKNKKRIIILIILLLLVCAVFIGLVIYKIYNPDSITAYIDGVKVDGFDSILDVQVDENGKTNFYIPIRDFATYLNKVHPEINYVTYKGDYNPPTEEDGKCYIVRNGVEAAIYSADSKEIYKIDLKKQNRDYEQYTIDKNVYLNKGTLYTSVDGIEKGYNVYFTYDENKKTMRINTLDAIIVAHASNLEKTTISSYGALTLTDEFTDFKALSEGALIVKTSSGAYGIISTQDYSNFILEPKYDSIKYIPETTDFLVKSNGKVGLFSKTGKRKIEMNYEELTQIGHNSKLYVMKSNNEYGVISEDGKTIIHPEFDQIGLDVNSFAYNGIKNGYILLNKLIPVRLRNYWAFFDTDGNLVSGKDIENAFKYTNVGYRTGNTNNIYSLLTIPEYNVLVVGDEQGKYALMDISGNDTIVPAVFEKIYIKISSGEKSYWVTKDGQDHPLEDLVKLGYLKKTTEN